MTVKNIVKLIQGDSNIAYIKLNAETLEAKKVISNASKPGDILLSAISITIFSARREEQFFDFEVLHIDIDSENTLTLTI